MKIRTSPTHSTLKAGLTFIELTAILVVLLSLISVLFVGVGAYKSGTDRASCVMNIHNVQSAVRSFSNLNGYAPGQDVNRGDSLRGALIGEDAFVTSAPECPGGGSYEDLGNRIPLPGELYLSCSLSGSERHAPKNSGTW